MSKNILGNIYNSNPIDNSDLSLIYDSIEATTLTVTGNLYIDTTDVAVELSNKQDVLSDISDLTLNSLTANTVTTDDLVVNNQIPTLNVASLNASSLSAYNIYMPYINGDIFFQDNQACIHYNINNKYISFRMGGTTNVYDMLKLSALTGDKYADFQDLPILTSSSVVINGTNVIDEINTKQDILNTLSVLSIDTLTTRISNETTANITTGNITTLNVSGETTLYDTTIRNNSKPCYIIGSPDFYTVLAIKDDLAVNTILMTKTGNILMNGNLFLLNTTPYVDFNANARITYSLADSQLQFTQGTTKCLVFDTTTYSTKNTADFQDLFITSTNIDISNGLISTNKDYTDRVCFSSTGQSPPADNTIYNMGGVWVCTSGTSDKQFWRSSAINMCGSNVNGDSAINFVSNSAKNNKSIITFNRFTEATNRGYIEYDYSNDNFSIYTNDTKSFEIGSVYTYIDKKIRTNGILSETGTNLFNGATTFSSSVDITYSDLTVGGSVICDTFTSTSSSLSFNTSTALKFQLDNTTADFKDCDIKTTGDVTSTGVCVFGATNNQLKLIASGDSTADNSVSIKPGFKQNTPTDKYATFSIGSRLSTFYFWDNIETSADITAVTGNFTSTLNTANIISSGSLNCMSAVVDGSAGIVNNLGVGNNVTVTGTTTTTTLAVGNNATVTGTTTTNDLVVTNGLNAQKGQLMMYIGEENASLTLSAFDFNYGNGANSDSNFGIVIPCKFKLKRFSYVGGGGSNPLSTTQYVFQCNSDGVALPVYMFIDFSNTTNGNITRHRFSNKFSSSPTSQIDVEPEFLNSDEGNSISWQTITLTDASTDNKHRITIVVETLEDL